MTKNLISIQVNYNNIQKKMQSYHNISTNIQQLNPSEIIGDCSTVFCGCQILSYDSNHTIYVPVKLYLYIIFSVVMVMGSVKLSLQWFTYKDYYPFKQKSPILCMLMIISICAQAILYPLVYFINYFTYFYTQRSTRTLFRAVQISLEFSIYSIYYLRCLRISFAHETHKSRRRSVAFRIFQREHLLAFSIVIVAILRALPVVFDPFFSDDSSWNFSLAFELAAFNGDDQIRIDNFYIIRNIFFNLFWQSLLIYCIWLNKNVNYRYSMRKELTMIVAAMQISNFLICLAIFQSLHESSTLKYMCSLSSVYPMTQFLRLINLLFALTISLILPLAEKKIYHALLPTGPHFGFTKTMRNFLTERQFLRVFVKYLEYLDEEERVDKYSKLLKLWQQLILFKLNAGGQSQSKKLQSIKILLQELSSTFYENAFLISKLKSAINMYLNQQSDVRTQISSQSESESNNIGGSSQITDLRRQKNASKYASQLNNKIDQLQEICLQKLNKVYTDKYSNTKSFEQLKKILSDNKRVNVNLIMLDMALIIDTDHDDNQ